MTNETPANAGTMQDFVPARDASGRFLPGSSGNRKGARRGSKHRSTLIAETILGREAQGLLEHAVELAKGPKGGATLRSLIPFLVAPLKSRPIRFELPEIRSAQDAVAAMDAMRAGMARGELTPDEVVSMAKALDSFVAVLKTADLDTRIAALEQTQKDKQQ